MRGVPPSLEKSPSLRWRGLPRLRLCLNGALRQPLPLYAKLFVKSPSLPRRVPHKNIRLLKALREISLWRKQDERKQLSIQ